MKQLISLLIFFFFLVVGMSAQTAPKPGFHKQVIPLKEGVNSARLDNKDGVVRIIVRDNKVVSATIIDNAGRQFALKLNINPPSASTNCNCYFDSEARFTGTHNGYDYCAYDCGSYPEPGEGIKQELHDFPLAWCTSDCPENPTND